jgi:hypothetical protein
MNESFLGPAPLTELAQHIVLSQGPSGANLEYAMELIHAHKSFFPQHVDSHLLRLFEQVNMLMNDPNFDVNRKTLFGKYMRNN